MDFRVFSLGSNDRLAQRIADTLGMPLGQIKCKAFADGEQHVQFLENLRGKNVYLVQSTPPPAENWLRLFLAIDAARGASASEISVVVPYLGYSRQDRKARPREPISSRVFAMTLENLGAARFLTMDLHNDAISGFFRHTIVDNLYSRRVFVPYFREFFKDSIAAEELVVVSPDVGGVVRAQSYAKRLIKTADLAIINKEREVANRVARMNLIGDVRDKVALIVDDMADTCGTLAAAAGLLKESGARKVYAAATHGVLSGGAGDALDGSPIERLFITDTISADRPLSKKIEIISVGELFGDAIQRIEQGESLSELFETE